MSLVPTIVGLLLVAASGIRAACAETITFEPDQGYAETGGIGSNGNLKGQPEAEGAQWTNPSDEPVMRIASDGDGGHWAQAHQNAENDSRGGGAPYILQTDADRVGSVEAGRLRFSFQYVLLERSSQTGLGIFQIGQGKVLHVEFYSDGKVYCKDGSGGSFVHSAGGGDFQAATNVLYTFSGMIDFTAKVFTLTVDDVDQGNPQTGLQRPFNDVSDLNGDIHLLAVGLDEQGWKPFAIDNIVWEVLP